MSTMRRVELANFVITMGEKGLLDLLPEILWPLMKTSKIPGRGEVYGYRFHDLSVDTFGGIQGYPCLFGRLIRLMTIQAEQRFDEGTGKIVPSQESVESAPSSFFVITLADHKMAFLPESRRRPPQLRDLEYCVTRLLRGYWRVQREQAHEAMLKDLGRTRIPRGHAEVWEEELEKRFPEPEIHISPLAASAELKKRLAIYELLQSVEIRPLKTNQELPDENSEFLQQYAKTKKRLGSRRDKIELANNKDGLVKPEAERLVQSASDGNYQVKLKGKDKNGHPIQDDLENLRIQVPYAMKKGETSGARAFRLLDILLNALKHHAVVAKEATVEVTSRAHQMIRSLKGQK